MTAPITTNEELPFTVVGNFGDPAEGDADPRPIVARLIDEVDIFQHLKIGEAVILTLFRRFDKTKAGRVILGEMCLPVTQGNLRPLFAWLLAGRCGGKLPDFLLILDIAWWEIATEHQREALVFHELMHAEHARDREGELRFDDDGRPIYAIRGHDIEEFDEVVRRYGAWEGDIRSFAAALQAGGVV